MTKLALTVMMVGLFVFAPVRAEAEKFNSNIEARELSPICHGAVVTWPVELVNRTARPQAFKILRIAGTDGGRVEWWGDTTVRPSSSRIVRFNYTPAYWFEVWVVSYRNEVISVGGGHVDPCD